MISEKKLSYYLHVSEHTCSPECQKIIAQLVDEVRKLQHRLDQAYSHATDLVAEVEKVEQEAQWLADTLAKAESCTGKDAHECFHIMDCAKCWRDSAKKAVQQ